jgi:predicted AAA+ superfamily ATPase
LHAQEFTKPSLFNKPRYINTGGFGNGNWWTAVWRSRRTQPVKKLYAVDPLILQIPAAIEGSAPPTLPALIENLTAVALYRACETDLVESFRLPQALCFWRSSRDREVDFLAGPRPHQIAVEVKYQTRVGIQDTLTIRKTLGRGLVLSRQDLALTPPVRTILASIFLALLRH